MENGAPTRGGSVLAAGLIGVTDLRLFVGVWRTALQPGVGSVLGAGLVGVTDMCLLDSLDEDSFLSNLRERFNHDQIYVSVVPLRRHFNGSCFGCVKYVCSATLEIV